MAGRILTKLRLVEPSTLLLIYFGAGAAGLMVADVRVFLVKLTPVTLLLSLGILFLHHPGYSRKFWIGWALVFLLGYVLEATGVKTGRIFGEYTYGTVLGPRLLETPVLIGANWVLLVYCSQVVAGRFIDSLYFRSISAASLMVVFDFALEPAAVKLGMWSWNGGAVPLQNYLVWFVAAFLLNHLAGSLRLVPEKNRAAAPLFFIQIGFFILLDLFFLVGFLLG